MTAQSLDQAIEESHAALSAISKRGVGPTWCRTPFAATSRSENRLVRSRGDGRQSATRASVPPRATRRPGCGVRARSDWRCGRDAGPSSGGRGVLDCVGRQSGETRASKTEQGLRGRRGTLRPVHKVTFRIELSLLAIHEGALGSSGGSPRAQRIVTSSVFKDRQDSATRTPLDSLTRRVKVSRSIFHHDNQFGGSGIDVVLSPVQWTTVENCISGVRIQDAALYSHSIDGTQRLPSQAERWLGGTPGIKDLEPHAHERRRR